MKVDFGTAFSFAVEKLKANPVFYIVGGLIVTIIVFIISMFGNVLSWIATFFVTIIVNVLNLQGSVAAEVTLILTNIILCFFSVIIASFAAPFFVGFFKGVKKEYEGGVAEISDIFSALNIFFPSVINYLVANVVVFIGFICCIIPGIILSPLLGITIYHLAHGRTSGLDAFKKSIETLKNAPILILWTFVSWILTILGLLLCCVGLLITAPLAGIILYVIYAQADSETGAITQKAS